MTSDVKANIRRVVTRGVASGETIRDTARAIRQVIPLHPRQMDALLSHAGELQDAGVEGDALQAQVDSYSGQLFRQRAELIARTETIRAISAGQHEMWRQADSRGVIEGAVRIWIVAPDEKLCPICREIPRMNPGGVGLGEPFRSPVGDVMFPPDPHPRCRCTIGLEFPE